jgi:hypothetical protein
MNTPLSYSRESTDNSFLDPEAYKGRITVPDTVLAEAKAKGYAVTMVAVDAAKNAEGGAFVRGFYALVDGKTGEKTLVPFVSGGYGMNVGAADFANAKKIEGTKDGPLPFAVSDATGDKDDIHYRGKITAVDLKPTLDDKGRDFKLWLQLGENGTAGSDALGGNRSLIGGHVNVTDAMTPAQREKLGKSHGCPVVPPAYEKVMEGFFTKHNITAGADYTILDPDKTVDVKAQAVKTAEAPPAPLPEATPSTPTPAPTPKKTPAPSAPPPTETASAPSTSESTQEQGGGGIFAKIMKFLQPIIAMFMGFIGNIGNMITGNNRPSETTPVAGASETTPSPAPAQSVAQSLTPSTTPSLAAGNSRGR